MNKIHDKILVMADKKTTALIKACAKKFSNLEVIEAHSENKAFELIYNYTLVLMIIDTSLPQIDTYKVGSMLRSHLQVHNTPLLILCDEIEQDNLLTDFDTLKIDYLLRPFTKEQVRSKIKIFFELFKQTNAVHQSIDELDRVYRKIIGQHEQSAKEEAVDKALSIKASHATNQIQQALRNHASNIHLLMRNHNLNIEEKIRLAAVKNAAEQISLTTKKLTSHIRFAKDKPLDQNYSILYVQESDEDFSIFNHFMRGVIKCDLTQGTTIAKSLELIYKQAFDLIFIDYAQQDGTGLELLAKLKRVRSDTPVIFTLDKPLAHKGPEAMSKGAFTYLLKEEFSSTRMLSIIHNTLEKAALTREVEDAQNRIVMISQKDYLTRLYNRRCFEEELESEISKARRYHTALSILLLDFDSFQAINDSHGFDAGDQVLAASATIIQGMVRGNDVVCRYGGEEFGIILSNTGPKGARMLAERLRRKMAHHDFETAQGSLNLTVSIGLAAFDPKTDTTYARLVKKGLNALTSAMEDGGNKVHVHTTDDK